MGEINARDLQTGLHAEGAHGREELEKSLLGLVARGEGRNAATLSVPPLLTCKEDKTFLFHFHEAPEMSELGKCGFQRPSWLTFVTSAGTHMAKVCGIPHASLTSAHCREGQIKKPGAIRWI